jgi:hypothetical protein
MVQSYPTTPGQVRHFVRSLALELAAMVGEGYAPQLELDGAWSSNDHVIIGLAFHLVDGDIPDEDRKQIATLCRHVKEIRAEQLARVQAERAEIR